MTIKKELLIIYNHLNKCENYYNDGVFNKALDHYENAAKRLKNILAKNLKELESEKIDTLKKLLIKKNKLQKKLENEETKHELLYLECLNIRQVKSCKECSRYETENCRLVLMKKGRI